MSPFHHPLGRLAAVVTGAAFALSAAALTLPAVAAGADRDHDGMSNKWESRHGLNPDKANARGDKDRDGLRNIAEFRRHSNPADEDSDNDGQDDGDEVHDGHHGTKLHDRDSDDDGTLDGDEDSNHDGVDNEDSDDSEENCSHDDDDSDSDHIDDEDENDFGFSSHDDDSDDDGVSDGNEDSDHDGMSDEDDDDSLSDDCSHHGGEDRDDLLGSIVSFDSGSGALVVDTAEVGDENLDYTVTEDTEIRFDNSGHGSSDRSGGNRATTDDLLPGTVVTEVDLDDDTGALEEIKIVQP